VNTTSPTGIRLRCDEDTVVRGVAKELNVSFSAAIRLIIRAHRPEDLERLQFRDGLGTRRR
jgi:hypothetical protein